MVVKNANGEMDDNRMIQGPKGPKTFRGDRKVNHFTIVMFSVSLLVLRFHWLKSIDFVALVFL